MKKRKTYPEGMSHKETLIFAGVAAFMMTFANMNQRVKTDSHFLTVTLTSLVPMIIIACGLNYYRVTYYRKGYEDGRRDEEGIQNAVTNLREAANEIIEKEKVSNEL